MREQELKPPRDPVLWGVTAVLVVALASLASPLAAENPCGECHEEQVAALRAGPHLGVVGDGPQLCVACHGDPTLHLDTGEAEDILGTEALADWRTHDQAAACLSCHSGDFPGFAETPHADRVSCWTCHADRALHHTPTLATPVGARAHASWDLCTSCHSDVRAEFRLQYRHPVEQGLVDCVDCHDVHGREPELAVDRQDMRAACVSCHHEQRGPYLFEHLAIEQGCVGCHRPHGSWNRGLLASSGNGVCLTCHLQSNFPGVGKIPHDFRMSGGGTCWDCHSDVHGSNTTPDFNPRGRR
jgi:DmsE family decaheme c-type cytochrome